jgi:hypothetical protein
MANLLLYRNIRARDQLDIFLISAILSLLGVRLYLELTDYPQIASGGLHIAHMLWGGLFMMMAIVVAISFLGRRAHQITAILGGIGFGVFIDELGKFITKDNDYFFQPTVGLIYAIFVVLYLAFNFLSRDRGMSSREYQINALSQLEEAVALDLDEGERRQVNHLLAKANQKSDITRELKNLVNSLQINTVQKHSRLHILVQKIDKLYRKFWQRKESHRIVQIVFLLQAVVLFITIVATAYSHFNDISFLFDDEVSYGDELILGQAITSVISIGFVVFGLSQLSNSRIEAFEYFRRSLLINIYLTQFFAFSRIQLEALPGLVASIVLLTIVSFVVREERRLQKL